MNPARIAQKLAGELKPLRFPAPVAYVYNPLEYAWPAHEQYLDRYADGPKEALLIGMNPGPWGMAQTGVPFGEVSHVRDWLKISAPIGRPPREHLKRPVLGLACPRREVSGLRLWGFFRETFGTPERFFKRFFVANYCPLMFLEAGGKNITPDKLPAAQRAALEAACDRHLRRLVEHLKPRRVIGVGSFAKDRAREALKGLNLRIGSILHPSPASPAANRGWAKAAAQQLQKQGIRIP